MLQYFGIKDIVDILVTAIIMYELYRFVIKSGTAPIFKGVLAFIVLWILVTQVFQMRLLGAIFNKFVSIGLIALVILFQDDIRHFLISLGSTKALRKLSRTFKVFGEKESITTDPTEIETTPLILACKDMAKNYTGALIVLEQEVKLTHIIESGESLNAIISTRLIENIFFKNSPLHDGAMIISNNKIAAAGCILPISQSLGLPNSFGLRHRAALGICQETDATVIVISEEKGQISFVSDGKIMHNISLEKLQEYITLSLKKRKNT